MCPSQLCERRRRRSRGAPLAADRVAENEGLICHGGMFVSQFFVRSGRSHLTSICRKRSRIGAASGAAERAATGRPTPPWSPLGPRRERHGLGFEISPLPADHASRLSASAPPILARPQRNRGGGESNAARGTPQPILREHDAALRCAFRTFQRKPTCSTATFDDRRYLEVAPHRRGQA